MTHMIACPECGQTLQVPGELIGAAVQCPQCRHAFTAAAPAESEPSKAAPAEPVASGPPPEEREARRAREDDDADEPMVPSIRRGQKPGHVTGMGIMALVGGIGAILLALALGGGSGFLCCLWPGTYYSLVIGILAVVRGSALLAANAYEQEPPRTLAVLMIVNIINGDMVCFVLGIIMLTFCGEKEVLEYLRRPARAA